MRRIMIDIETLDTLPTAMILSIGAVAFDPDLPAERDEHFYTQIDSRCTPVIGTIGVDTVRWWLQQSDEARQAITKPGGTSINFALLDLSRFIGPVAEAEIWAGPATFDIPILEHSYRECGFPVPWHHASVRCWTTLREVLGIYKLSPTIVHHALDDAQAQVAAFRLAWAKLKTLGKRL
jgi:hypothetical protein